MSLQEARAADKLGAVQWSSREAVTMLAIELLAQGYTTRMVRYKMTKRGVPEERIPEEVELVILRQQHAPEISDLQESLERETLTRGLARRSERVRRLSRLGEKLEHELDLEDLETKVPLKVSAEYRKTLGQIQAEVDPLGLQSVLDPDDPWVVMIAGLMRLGQGPQSRSNTPSLTNSGSAKELPEPNSGHSSHEPDLKLSLEESEEESRSTPQQSSLQGSSGESSSG